jgi:hypothetical protein
MDCTVSRGVREHHGPGHVDIDGGAPVILHVGEFLGKAIAEESTRLGVTVEELATFALLYYLADLDGDRIARRIPPSS